MSSARNLAQLFQNRLNSAYQINSESPRTLETLAPEKGGDPQSGEDLTVCEGSRYVYSIYFGYLTIRALGTLRSPLWSKVLLSNG